LAESRQSRGVAAPRWHARPSAATAAQAFTAAQGDAFSAQWLLEYCRVLLRKAAQAAKPSQQVIAGAMAGLASALSVCPVRAPAPAAAPGAAPDNLRPRSASCAPACGAPGRSGRQAAPAPAARCGCEGRADTRVGPGAGGPGARRGGGRMAALPGRPAQPGARPILGRGGRPAHDYAPGAGHPLPSGPSRPAVPGLWVSGPRVSRRGVRRVLAAVMLAAELRRQLLLNVHSRRVQHIAAILALALHRVRV